VLRIVSQKNQQQTLRFKQQTLRLSGDQAGPDRPAPGGSGPGCAATAGGGDEGRAGPAARDAPRRRSGRAGRATGGSGPGCAATAEVAVMKAGPGQPGPGRLRPGMRRNGGGGGDEGRAGPRVPLRG
jgi:hypothetical protein